MISGTPTGYTSWIDCHTGIQATKDYESITQSQVDPIIVGGICNKYNVASPFKDISEINTIPNPEFFSRKGAPTAPAAPKPR